MREFTKIMKGLADPNRVKITKLLQECELCVCHLTQALCLAQSTTSKHLQILQEAGLLFRSKEGLLVKYKVADGRTNRCAACLLGEYRMYIADRSGSDR